MKEIDKRPKIMMQREVEKYKRTKREVKYKI